MKSLAVSLLVFLFLCVQPVKAEQGESGAQQKSPDATSNIQPPSATVTASPVNDPNVKKVETPVSKPERDSKQGKAVTRAEKIQIGISAFIALVVFWQGWIYNQQRKIMQEQKRMAAIAERAYIVLSRFIINPVVNNNLIITGNLINGGRTPAYELQSKNMVTLLPEGEKPPPFAWNSFPDKEGTSLIPAGGERNMDFPSLTGVTPERWDVLIAGKLTLTVEGECRYLDHTGDRQVLAFGFNFDLTGDRARSVEKYQRHYPQSAKPN